MSLDSVAVFSARVTELGLGRLLPAFTAQGWSTHGSFAFASAYTPGGEEPVFEAEIVRPLSTDPRHRPPLRRLFFESYTLAASDLKRRVEVTSEDAPRKIPTVEREERREALARRLVGTNLEQDELCASDRLIDRCIEMAEENTLRYVGPEQSTQRTMELRGVKKDPAWVPDANGTLRMKSIAPDADEIIESQFALHFAWRRRGFALEMADLMAVETHDTLVAALVANLLRPPLPGYSKVDLSQVLRADFTAFKLLAKASRKGVRRDEHGLRPCDVHMPAVLQTPEFLQTLAQLPALASGKRSVAEVAAIPPDPPSGLSKRAKKRAKQESSGAKKLAAMETELLKKFGPQSAFAKQHNSSTPREGRERGTLPKGLEGKIAKTSKGERICYGYNLGTCKFSAADCSRGLHVCMEPVNGQACGKQHPCSQHA